MIHQFTDESIEEISRILGASAKKTGNIYRIELKDEQGKNSLAIEININLQVDNDQMNLISVYAQQTFLQLHNCTGFVASDILNQVTFFGKKNGIVSGLIVEQESGCSLYSNVDESLLQGDFTKLPTEVMMSSVALSLTENIDFEGFSFEEDQ
jgi:hypothetical protein